MTDPYAQCHLLPDATEALIRWAKQVQRAHDDPFVAAQHLAKRLGAHLVDGKAELGFWVPELAQRGISPERVFLEIYTPSSTIDLSAPLQEVSFRRELVALEREGDYLWGVVEGMQPGNRCELGSLYWLTYKEAMGRWETSPDALAASLPFGAFAPAEFYDVARMQAERKDKAYYAHLAETAQAEVVNFEPPTNILQLHVPTATADGTLAGLTRTLERIAEKVRSNEPLSPEEQVYRGYDAVQPLPLEPIIEYEMGPHFWQPLEVDTKDDAVITLPIQLRRPDMTNWGYDIVLSASSATNPVLLETRRPDEVLDFVAALHNFPGQPLRLILDVVYGHADNQALSLLNAYWFRGPNMYGQDVNQQHPVVRALMLELQRRKVDIGADGVRVDGAQDFKLWNAAEQVVEHDDAYLQAMSAVTQEVAGVRYQPWMIFEDGRPWPREDWPTASTYDDVIKLQPDVFQWGPLTFAHNTPALRGFWNERWWRVEEIYTKGSHWISGCANHDTVRRGTQIDLGEPINTRLGEHLPDILQNAYDNPAAHLLAYTSFPGVPMDFLNASAHTPWGFIRNTDDLYGVKVVSEETLFLWWQVDELTYAQGDAFRRLKALGFHDLNELRRFMKELVKAVTLTSYSLVTMVDLLQNALPPLAGPALSMATLKHLAKAFMDDAHDYCSVSLSVGRVNEVRASFNLAVREFRRARPWLIRNLTERDRYGRTVTDEVTLFYSLRTSPEGDEQVLFVANMEGDPANVTPTELPLDGLEPDNWQLALAAPGVNFERADTPVTLADSQGVVLTRKM